MKKEGAGWGCPHDHKGRCVKRDEDCEPGAEGCVLEERFARKTPVREKPAPEKKK